MFGFGPYGLGGMPFGGYGMYAGAGMFGGYGCGFPGYGARAFAWWYPRWRGLWPHRWY